MLRLSLTFLVLTTAQTVQAQPRPLTMDSLSCMSWNQLEAIYRQFEGGTMPCGYYKGKAIYCKGRFGSRLRSGLTKLVWEGKHFECDTIVNQWKAVKMLPGKVYRGKSWYDGKPSIILDYRNSSLLWRKVRDEIRQVGPNLYLGIMHIEKKCEPEMRCFFILEKQCCK